MKQFAYLFERFPSFTQTFCYREVLEMRQQEGEIPVFSIRKPEDVPSDCPEALARSVTYLPTNDELARGAKWRRLVGRVPLRALWTLATWGKRPDRLRAYAALWLGMRLKKMGVRHVHVHFAGMAARTAYWLKKFFGIGFSFTAHANDVFCGTNNSVTIDDLMREASLVVTVSDFSRDWLRSRYPLAAEKIHRVYNGIDLASFPQATPRPGKPHILSVGRCIEKKGFADLIDACAILHQGGLEFECSIIGNGPLEEALRQRVIQCGLEGVVHMIGPKTQEEVRALMAQCSLFVLACVTEPNGGMDNLPTVIAEAMAAALPVVSTRLAGVPEMVEHGGSGLLVCERDFAALAEAMKEILTDPEKMTRFGERGKELAQERFAIEHTVGELRRLTEQYAG